MARAFLKRTSLVLGLATMGLAGCDGVSVGVGVGGYYDPFYDSMLWNDYYHGGDINIDIDAPDRPDRPDRPGRPTPPIAKPPVARPPVARPPVARPPAARPPIHRPAPRRR